MESEAVLICMAFPILRKYFWQEEVGEEEGEGHFSSIEISLQVRNMKEYRRHHAVIEARLLKNQVAPWDVPRMVN